MAGDDSFHGLLKKLAGDEEVTWDNYRKFQVDSKVVATE
jgi:hypothetical protein